MKKLFLLSTFFLCILMTKNVYSQDYSYRNQYVQDQRNTRGQYAQDAKGQYVQDLSTSNNGSSRVESGDNGAVSAYSQNQGYYSTQDRPCEDQPMNDCWCLYVHYEPCYYNTKRCIEEKVPCKKQCCRYVPQYYEVDRCRYVPQYYKETCCRYVPQYYCVDDCKTCYKWVCDQHCKYVPQYYWKHVCGQAGCATACPTTYPAANNAAK